MIVVADTARVGAAEHCSDYSSVAHIVLMACPWCMRRLESAVVCNRVLDLVDSPLESACVEYL